MNAGKEAKKSEKREFWAETQEEAKALKAKAEASKTPAKPKKSKNEIPSLEDLREDMRKELADILSQMLAGK